MILFHHEIEFKQKKTNSLKSLKTQIIGSPERHLETQGLLKTT